MPPHGRFALGRRKVSGFPINPPRTSMVDGNGACSPEWYRFFVQIQKLIGGPSSPFDDSALLSTLPQQVIDYGSGDYLPPPVVHVVCEDALASPAVPCIDYDDMLPPNLAQALFGMNASIFAPGSGYVTRSITATGSVNSTDYLILADATGGAITVNLPAVASSAGRGLVVKKTDARGNAVTLDGSGAETIDGAATQAIAAQYDALMVVCDGSAWWIV